MNQASPLSADERLIRPDPANHEAANGKPAFADLPLARKLNIDEEIKFVDDLLSKYVAANDKARAPFQEIKTRVAERQRESRLFLGVIGEFSSGKSTLVNALIRESGERASPCQQSRSAKVA